MDKLEIILYSKYDLVYSMSSTCFILLPESVAFKDGPLVEKSFKNEGPWKDFWFYVYGLWPLVYLLFRE